MNWNMYDGHANRSETFCTFDGSLTFADPLNDASAYTSCTTCALNSGAIHDYGAWMEAGNSFYGLSQVRLIATEELYGS